MRPSDWDKPVAHGAQTVTEMHYLRDRDGRDNVMMLENLRCDLDDGWAVRPVMVTYCLLNSVYNDDLSFLSW